jgi:hypothetical protein
MIQALFLANNPFVAGVCATKIVFFFQPHVSLPVKFPKARLLIGSFMAMQLSAFSPCVPVAHSHTRNYRVNFVACIFHHDFPPFVPYVLREPCAKLGTDGTLSEKIPSARGVVPDRIPGPCKSMMPLDEIALRRWPFASLKSCS